MRPARLLLSSDSSLCLRLVCRYRLINGCSDSLIGQSRSGRRSSSPVSRCQRVLVAAWPVHQAACISIVWASSQLAPALPPAAHQRTLAQE